MTSYSLGPGLTSQLGPFKTNKTDLPQIQTRPWKGGGVPAGGQKHAGNGNWMQVMNPQAYPIKFPKPTSVGNHSAYASVVTAQDLFSKNSSHKSVGRFSKPFHVTGQPNLDLGVQKAGLGFRDSRMERGQQQEVQASEESLANQADDTVKMEIDETEFPNVVIKQDYQPEVSVQTDGVDYNTTGTDPLIKNNIEGTGSQTYQQTHDVGLQNSSVVGHSGFQTDEYMNTEATRIMHNMATETDPVERDKMMSDITRIQNTSTQTNVRRVMKSYGRLAITGSNASSSTSLIKQNVDSEKFYDATSTPAVKEPPMIKDETPLPKPEPKRKAKPVESATRSSTRIGTLKSKLFAAETLAKRGGTSGERTAGSRAAKRLKEIIGKSEKGSTPSPNKRKRRN